MSYGKADVLYLGFTKSPPEYFLSVFLGWLSMYEYGDMQQSGLLNTIFDSEFNLQTAASLSLSALQK
jgi:hypothetical protein